MAAQLVDDHVRQRDRPGAGYWIVEADPDAAHHAIHRQYPRAEVDWCVLAIDGAHRGLDHLHCEWPDLPKFTATELRTRLDNLNRWEEDVAPKVFSSRARSASTTRRSHVDQRPLTVERAAHAACAFRLSLLVHGGACGAARRCV